MTDLIGWIASTLLFATMAAQTLKQWQSGAVGGVSKLLFIGQFAASLLFTAYSVLKDDTVYIVVNVFMLANALVGLWVDRRNRAQQPPPDEAAAAG